jgi:2-polyprenyl-6-methoxyphenol hydroxylase-like FAD-dependent oxidoreductase
MNGMRSDGRVIIVGGGPVGLVSALALAQREIPVLVLEAHSELFLDLRAGSFHPPTLEVLEASGITKKLLDIGIVVPAWQLRDRTDGVIGTFELASLLKDETPYPFRLHCEQHKLTPLVYDMLKDMPHVEVRFSCRVTTVEQNGDRIIVNAETPNGKEVFDGGWVIGADGGGSIVRKSADIPFEGFTYPEKFALISTPFDLGRLGFTDTAYISHPVEWCAVFRLPHLGPPGLWRFLYGCDPNEDDETALSDDRVEERLQAVVPKKGRYETVHRTIYRVHQRVAETFRKGRMLLAGDSAHLNNPLGGFGLNSALQDAINLTDKLSHVWRGDEDDTVLDRYVRQRRTVNIEYVQEASIRNKRTLEETDPVVRKQRLDELRRASEIPALAKDVVMKSSMISSMRRANSIM